LKRIAAGVAGTLFGMTAACDAAQMIVVPDGRFTIGSPDGPADEKPAHEIHLSEFRIDKYPITHAGYAAFLNAQADAIRDRLYDHEDADARIHLVGGRWRVDAAGARGTHGGGHDSPVEQITTAQRGRTLSRNPRSGHHNIGSRCAL
jgi:formylglycine-generating enzyme required for sulfatase activity